MPKRSMANMKLLVYKGREPKKGRGAESCCLLLSPAIPAAWFIVAALIFNLKQPEGGGDQIGFSPTYCLPLHVLSPNCGVQWESCWRYYLTLEENSNKTNDINLRNFFIFEEFFYFWTNSWVELDYGLYKSNSANWFLPINKCLSNSF